MPFVKHKFWRIINLSLRLNLSSFAAVFLVLFFSPFCSLAQKIPAPVRPAVKQEAETKISEARMKEIIQRREELIKKGIKFKTTHRTKTGNPPPLPLSICGDLGGENGWGLWQGVLGDADYNNTPPITMGAAVVPSSPRFNITSGTGIDQCTPGPNVGDPAIPVVAPGFGLASIQLGEPAVNGTGGGCNLGCVEQAMYPFTVTPQDTSFIYAYALVYEFPSSGHTISQAPFAEIYILAPNGDTIPCSHTKYVADVSGTNTVPPGMFQALPCGTNGNDVVYKPWTIVGVNLSAYVGQTLSVVITNADCALGGHFCHSYWDFQCNSPSVSTNPICFGQQSNLCAPASDPLNPYTYQWFKNSTPFNSSHPWTPVSGGNAQCILVTPVAGDSFLVHVMQPSGCSFYLPVVPLITSITANFTFSSSCGKLTFTDSSYVSSAPSLTIASWDWQFPGGTPAASVLQNPGTIIYPSGAHTVTLIVTSSAGCKDTIIKQIVFHNKPNAFFNEKDLGCEPVCHVFKDSSQSINDPITNWIWSFPGGSPSSSSQMNPGNVCYDTPGDYGASIIVATSFGCKDTLQLNNIIHVYSWPTAGFYMDQAAASTNAPVFNFCKQWSSDVVKWRWNFGDGSPIDSVDMNPTHSYTASVTNNDWFIFPVCIYVENIHGCFDTICHTVEMVPDFSFYIPNCFTPNNDFVNEGFYAKSVGVKKYQIEIFDRWGNLIYECNHEGKNTDWDNAEGMSSACKWDGVVQGGGLDMSGYGGGVSEMDVYVWKVVLTDIFEKTHHYSGIVSIVK